MSVSFGELFRAELARRGLTQSEAASQLGIKQQEASDWARGARLPANHRIPGVARWMHLPKAQVVEVIEAERNVSARLSELEQRTAVLEKMLQKIARQLGLRVPSQ